MTKSNAAGPSVTMTSYRPPLSWSSVRFTDSEAPAGTRKKSRRCPSRRRSMLTPPTLARLLVTASCSMAPGEASNSKMSSLSSPLISALTGEFTSTRPTMFNSRVIGAGLAVGLGAAGSVVSSTLSVAEFAVRSASPVEPVGRTNSLPSATSTSTNSVTSTAAGSTITTVDSLKSGHGVPTKVSSV